MALSPSTKRERRFSSARLGQRLPVHKGGILFVFELGFRELPPLLLESARGSFCLPSLARKTVAKGEHTEEVGGRKDPSSHHLNPSCC